MKYLQGFLFGRKVEGDDPWPCENKLGLYIIYFKRYDKYHETHEPIFNTYQQYILSYFKPNNVISPPISWDFGNFIDQNTLHLRKNVSFEVSLN